MHLNEQPAKERPINMLLRACRSSADKRKIISKAILPPCVHGRTLCMHLNSHQWDHLHCAGHHHFQLFQPPHLICMQSLFSMFHLAQPKWSMGTSYWGYFLEPFPHRSRDLSGKEIIDFLVHFSPSVFCRTGSRLVVVWNVAQSGLRHQCYHLHHPHYPHHPHYHHYHLIPIIFIILIIIIILII